MKYIFCILITNFLHKGYCRDISSMNNKHKNTMGDFDNKQRAMDTDKDNITQPMYNDDAGLLNIDLYLDGPQLINKYGFPVETHHVQTSDGYILTMFRIPCGGNPAFLMHGLIGSADDFVIAGPESAIGYLLAYEGYDVWLGNARGNKYSRKHKILSPDTDTKFWDFSWNEIGLYDVPAMIDYVMNTTGYSHLAYIGHSQGTTCFFVMCSERLEYNDKISVMVALSAVAWISHTKSPVFRTLAPYNQLEYFIAKTFGFNELLPSNVFTKTLSKIFCGTEFTATVICANIYFQLFGYDYDQVNITNLPNFFQHLPSGSSIKQVIHYFQEVISGKFRKFDYGKDKNIEMYGNEYPPSYLVNRVTVPVAIFYSDNDWLATITDVNILRRKLPNVIDFYRVPYENFNHIDYILARNIKQLVFYKLSKILNKYNRSTNYTSLCPAK